MKKTIIILFAFFFIHQTLSQSWTQTLNGISMWSLCKDYSGKIYAGTSGTVRSIYRSATNGDSWDTVLSNGVTNFLYLASDSANSIYAANGSNGLLKTTSAGSSWTTIPSSTFGNKSVQAVICGRNGYVYVGTITGGIYRSTDNGSTFPDNTITTLTIVTLAVDKYNSNIIYAGASSGAAPNYGFYRSTDAGSTWSVNLNPYNIWGIVQKPNALFTITTSTGYNFDMSTNGGLNWTTVSYLTGAMRGMTLDLYDNYIYTSGNGGVFRSTNNGLSFTNINLTYSCNQILNSNNRLLVAVSGTTNGGIYTYTYPLGIKLISTEIPQNFLLKQNFPNPFNPITKISFQLPVNGITNLELYNLLGEEIESLVNQNLQAGEYEVSWDASKYPSGVYFYKLISGNYTDTKKMVLIK
jgi:hypothetical protein